MPAPRRKSKSTAFLLCYFLGLLGVHRFYLGRWPTGLLMLITLGGLLIWWMVDAVLVAAGLLKDARGRSLRVGPPDPSDPSAGFWVRTAAFSVDLVILQAGLSVVVTGLSFLLPLVMLGSAEDLAAMETMNPDYIGLVAGGIGAGLSLLAVPLYFGLQTAGRHRATIGKRCFDLQVTDMAGQRIGLGRAVWRSLCYFLSSLTLGLGYVLTAFTARKRALHDFLAGTRVQHVVEERAAAAARAALPSAVDRDAVTTPRETPTMARSAGAASVDPAMVHGTGAMSAGPAVARGSGSNTVLMALGAVLLAGAAAVALLL